MRLDFMLAKLGYVSLASLVSAIKRRWYRKEGKRLLSTAIAELLKEHPDIHTAEAIILAVEAAGIEPDPGLLRAKWMLDRVKRHGIRFRKMARALPKAAGRRAKKKPRKRPIATRKVGKKKAAR